MTASHRAVWALAWPMIVANLSVPLLGLVDTAILGHLDGPRYLAAVAVGSTVITFAFWAFGFLRMGTTSLVARAFGGAQHDQTRLLLSQGLVLGAVLGTLVIASQWLWLPLALTLMGAEPAVAALAREYLQIRVFSAPAVLMGYAVVGWFLGMQNTRAPLLIVVLTNALNIGLDAWFILGLGWGSAGAAWASLTAEWCGLLVGLGLAVLWLRGRPGRWHWQPLARWHRYRELLRVNRHLFVRTALLLGVFAFVTAQGARLGTEVLAANAILLNLLMVTAHGLDGFAHATEALAGKALGSGRVDRFFSYCRAATAWALAVSLGFVLLFLAAREPLLHLYTDLPAVLATAREHYLWLAWLPLVAVWSYQLDGIFIGAGRTRAMQNTMLLCVPAFIGLWWWTQGAGNHGLWLALTGFMALRGLTLGAVFAAVSRNRSWERARALS